MKFVVFDCYIMYPYMCLTLGDGKRLKSISDPRTFTDMCNYRNCSELFTQIPSCQPVDITSYVRNQLEHKREKQWNLGLSRNIWLVCFRKAYRCGGLL